MGEEKFTSSEEVFPSVGVYWESVVLMRRYAVVRDACGANRVCVDCRVTNERERMAQSVPSLNR